MPKIKMHKIKNELTFMTDRSLLDYLEKENEALKNLFFEKQQRINEAIKEIKKRMKVDDAKGIRTERWNPKTQKWGEIK